MRRLLGGLAAALAVTSVSCSTEPQYPAEFQVLAGLSEPLDNRMLQVTAEASGSRWEFDGSTFVPAPHSTGPVQAPTSGQLKITVRVRGDSNQTLATGWVAVDLEPDVTLWFGVSADSSSNPTRYCFGCWGSKSMPLAEPYRRVPNERLWIIWGGNWIHDPVVY